jgi:hypothetical protein
MDISNCFLGISEYTGPIYMSIVISFLFSVLLRSHCNPLSDHFTVIATEPVNAASSGSFLMTKLRMAHKQRQHAANDVHEQAAQAKLESMTVKHKAIPDPSAYDKLENIVLRAKASQVKKVEEVRRVIEDRASLRKGGLHEVQEMLSVLPPSSGPLGRIWRPIFNGNTLSDEEETVATVVV